ncbi:hypothetical protein [Paremcibacter congregatus]|uniref:hypothetical protein n=1 Tax=Paremcibacter congregatus TaxID=2043170 RepID=UPI00105661F1|nr:hypothetical protein [Paremcibacter congregatus]QDE26870.1 hypothetical protein FIV45_06075 [Paremcibacter congregatus]
MSRQPDHESQIEGIALPFWREAKELGIKTSLFYPILVLQDWTLPLYQIDLSWWKLTFNPTSMACVTSKSL